MSEIFHKIDQSNIRSLVRSGGSKSNMQMLASDTLRKSRDLFKTVEENTEFRSHFKMMRRIGFECFEGKW